MANTQAAEENQEGRPVAKPSVPLLEVAVMNAVPVNKPRNEPQTELNFNQYLKPSTVELEYDPAYYHFGGLS